MATVDAVDKCQFYAWYPKFKKYTMSSDIIELSEDFVEYLNEDGVFIPSFYAPVQVVCFYSSDYYGFLTQCAPVFCCFINLLLFYMYLILASKRFRANR